MTHSQLTDQIRESTTQRTPRKARIDTFLIHHQAGTNDDAVIAGMQAHSGVSSNYTISNEGRLTLVVNEDFRAWTSGSSSDGGKGAAWDHRSITVEIENEAGAPAWPISQAAIDKAAALLNDLKRRYGVSIVLGHRDLWNNYQASYPTFCPGPDTVARIVARAAELENPAAVEQAKARVRTIATYLNSLGLAAFKSAAASDGIPLDPGDTYSKYWHLVQLWGVKYRPDVYDPRINSTDGIVGPNTRRTEAVIWEALQAGTAPGLASPPAPEPEPTPEPTPEPEPVPVQAPRGPLFDPDPTKLEDAVDVVTDQVARYLPEETRGKVYDAVTAVGGVAAGVGVSALAVAPVVGGEVGSWIATIGAIATTIGTLAGVAAARLAKANKQDPIRTETLSVKVLSGK